MASTEVLKVEVRDSTGTRSAKRLRKSGRIPAVLYGHGKPTLSLSLSASEVAATLRHGAKVVELQGGVRDDAFIREVQWDSLGHDILHLDLTRVEAGESVEITVALELRGVAPGTKVGGILDHVLHEVQLNCPISSIPERLFVNVNSLELGESVHASDLELPSGATLLTDAHALVVQCIEPVAEQEAEEVAAEGAEPEVIGRKESDEEEE